MMGGERIVAGVMTDDQTGGRVSSVGRSLLLCFSFQPVGRWAVAVAMAM
jgi:hypothetical protein